MRKQSILVISPHIDDELYGCLGFILKMSKVHPVDIVYVTTSEDQKKRFDVVSKLYSKYNIHPQHLELFNDGDGDSFSVKKIAQVFDKLVCKYDTILVNSLSNHQDHNLVHDALMISLRTRPDLKATTVLEYDYCYNQLTIDQRGCLTYYFEEDIYKEVTDVWGRFEALHSVSKDVEHVTHFSKANLLNEFLGAYRSYPYAERFHIVKMDIIPKEW